MNLHHNGVTLPINEKRKPSHDLAAFQAALRRRDGVNFTGAAVRGAAELGFGHAEMLEVLQAMERRHFYKSMTSKADHRQWQDVYHAPSPAGLVYVKFTLGVVSQFTLLSFKAKDHD